MVLDKCPGIWPIGIGDIWRRLLAKCVLKVTGAEAKDACGNMQMCAGLEAGIEGAVHAAQALYAEKEDKEEWGFLLVDTANAFNAGNRITCLWTAPHHWPSGVRFSFNYYSHQALLLVRVDDGYAGHLIWSRKGVTQGNPLVIILYGLGVVITLSLKIIING